MWTCHKCGSDNQDLMNYCPRCGRIKAPSRNIRRKPNLFLPITATCILIIIVLTVWIVNLLPSTAKKAEIVDVVRLADAQKGDALIALLSDGTLRTAGLDNWFGEGNVRQINTWTNLVQVETYMNKELFGLKADGSVVSTYIPKDSSYNNPNQWTNVKKLIIGNIDYYALTCDGHILVAEKSPTQSLNRFIISWTNVDKAAYFAYPEARGVIALQSDGTVLLPGDYYPFTEPPEEGIDIDSSGFIHCCLQKDGRIKITGLETTYNQKLVEDAERITSAVQVVVYSRGLACRLRDGTVVSCGRIPDDTSKWQDVVNIQNSAAGLLGLTKGGSILFSSLNEGYQRADQELSVKIERELSTWRDIVRIKSYGEYVLGWQSNGTMLAAGIDLGTF